MPLYLFSLVFLVLVVFILWRKEDIIPIVGKILGPLKIAGIILIIFAAIWQSPQLVSLGNVDSALILGLTQGYQTMDLMASFFFSVVIVEYLSTICKTKKETLKVSLLATAIGAFCIAGVYFGLLALGAHYASDLANVNAEQYLATIAKLTLGHNAAWIVSITIFLSCLATGATLVRLFAEFLRIDIAKEKISWHVSVYITIAISFALSLTGFITIITVLQYILTYAYPALITLSITAILQHFYGFKWSKLAFFMTLAITVISKILV